jgi:predicted nucleic acid-binding protein
VTSRRLVIDANILVRAVLGPRVRNLIVDFAEEITFFAPSVAFADASRHLPTLVGKRGIDTSVALSTLDTLRALVDDVPDDLMAQRKDEAFVVSRSATPTTGRSSRQLLLLIVRSGPRTRTSSEPECRPG